MRTEEIVALNDRYLMNTFGERGISIQRGQGTRVWDPEGNAYLDFLSGISVNNLGHCHPRIVEAIQRQCAELIHCTNLYYIEPAIRLAQVLCGNSFADRAYFCNSGAEANEAALKLARKYARENAGVERIEYISFYKSFHGRTFATLTATGQDKIHKGFEPLVPGFHYAEFNDLAGVQALMTDRIAAVIVEPILGEGGVYPATPEFLQGLRRVCDENRSLLIFDEIQTGLGRVGRNFAYEHYDVEPDIMTIAKSLAGGLPMGALLAREYVAAAFTPGSHGGTMGGNPVAASAALAYCHELFDNGLAKTAAERGRLLRGRLERLKDSHPSIVEIRGIGLMQAIQLDRPSADIVKSLEKAGLLTGCVAGHSIRFLPPLNASPAEIDEAMGILDGVLSEIGEPASVS